jgi:hypothetical protein
LNPSGRQPLSAQAIHTANCCERPFSRPASDTISSVDKTLLQATQVATSALLSFAFSLGICGAPWLNQLTLTIRLMAERGADYDTNCQHYE